MGDYDSAVWTARFLPKWWTDPCHGSRPLAWPFNPNLSDRVPMVFEYAYEYKKDNDFFTGGDSGAGYLNPTLLLEPRKHSDNPSGMQLWIEHNKKYYQKMDLDITGFLLNGALPIDDRVLDAYCEISPAGTGIHNYANCKILHKNGVFFDVATFIAGQDGDPDGVYARTMERIHAVDAPQFHALRSVLCSPTYMENLISRMQESDPDIEVVDPYTFFELLRISAGN